MKILPSLGVEPGREGRAPGPWAAPRGRVGGGSEEPMEWALPTTKKGLEAPHSRWEFTLFQPPPGSHQHPSWYRTLTASKQLLSVPKGCGQAKHSHGLLPSPLSKWPCFQASPHPHEEEGWNTVPKPAAPVSETPWPGPQAASAPPPSGYGGAVCFKSS